MPYTKTTWNPGAAPGISAANLNNLETQYDEAMADSIVKVYKAADETINNSVVLQNDDDLLIPVEANEVCLFILTLKFISDTIADFKHIFTVPVAATLEGIQAMAARPATTPTLIDATAVMNHSLPAGAYPQTVGFTGFYLYIGGVNAGNVQLQWAQLAAVAQNCTVNIGSHLTKITLS